MGTTPIRPLVDRVLEGRLDEVLRRYSALGLSPSRMALRLASEYQVEVSGPTVKKWLAGLRCQERESPTAECNAQAAQTAQTVCTAKTTRNEGDTPRIAS